MRLLSRAAPLALACLAAMAGLASAQQGSIKIAYVNTQALLDAAPGRAAAEAIFQREAESYRAELKTMGDSINALIASYQKAEPLLSTAQKDTRSKQIRMLEEQFQGKQQALTTKAQTRQNELMTPIMEQVKKVLDDIRTEEGYALILAQDPSLILSSDKNLDITDKVVARLKTAAATKPLAGAPVAAPSGVTTRPKPRSQ